MTIRIALNHRSSYRFDRPVVVSPHLIRLRPAPHCRTPITAYSLRVAPDDHFINWQQDPQGNYVARLVFPERLSALEVEVDVIAEMTAINPFDFFLEPEAECVPFVYPEVLRSELEPYRRIEPVGSKTGRVLESVDRSQRKTIDFLVDLNCRLQQDVGYVIRLEPGVQTCDETLTLGTGSCRDSAWLMVQILRNLGMAARFVSGYLIQLVADQKPLDGPEGPSADFTDLHAWCEVFLPGAGWVGLDPTSGLLAGEGHIPLACTPEPASAAPITGATEICETQFDYTMAVTRIHEDPRVTKPYTEQQWQTIQAVGHQVDQLFERRRRASDDGWRTDICFDRRHGRRRMADRGRGADETSRWRNDCCCGSRTGSHRAACCTSAKANGIRASQLPRWALSCFWRHDGEPIWRNAASVCRQCTGLRLQLRRSRNVYPRVVSPLGIGLSVRDPGLRRRLVLSVAGTSAACRTSHPRDVRLEDDGADEAVATATPTSLRTGTRFARSVACCPCDTLRWQAEPRWQTGPWPAAGRCYCC